jgi:hypothetical protein
MKITNSQTQGLQSKVDSMLTRNEGLELVKNMAADMTREVLSPKSHKVGKESTPESPKYDPVVQAQANLLDW